MTASLICAMMVKGASSIPFLPIETICRLAHALNLQKAKKKKEEVRDSLLYRNYWKEDHSTHSKCFFVSLPDSITALGAEPPTYLFIQMQLCQKESLKEWLTINVHNRRRETILHFFTQVMYVSTCLYAK